MFVQEVGEDVVHKMLEQCQSVCKSEWHNAPLEQPVPGPEHSLPFIALGNVDEV